MARDAVADYVADLAGELAAMARTSRLDVLARLLEIARLEASAEANGRNRTLR